MKYNCLAKDSIGKVNRQMPDSEKIKSKLITDKESIRIPTKEQGKNYETQKKNGLII